MNKEYVFANWAQPVKMIDSVGRLQEGVITEFDNTSEMNTKIVYKNGGFDWYNRGEIEAFNKTLEVESILAVNK